MYETLFRRVLFPAYETLVKRRQTPAHRQEYEQSQWLDPASLQALQLLKLNQLLAHCWREVPFLQRHWRQHGLQPGPLSHVSDLSRFPLLTKADIRANYEDMIAGSYRGRTISKATGGSTGEPFRFEYTMEVYARRTAIMWRGYGWAGAGLGVRTGYLWGTAMGLRGLAAVKERVYHNAFNRRFFDAFALTDSRMDALVEDMRRFRPAALVGYVSPVVHLARHLLSSGQSIPSLKTVVTGAEALQPADRELIEAAFRCPAFNTYGSRETMLMASECEQHAGLHVNGDHLLVETVDADGQAVVGAMGQVAVTDLHNLGMPLVRYQNGDLATQSPHACPCGRGLPLLQSVDGRSADMIRSPDGRRLPGLFFPHLMKDYAAIRSFQVHQHELNRLVVLLVASRPLEDTEITGLKGKIRDAVGDQVEIALQFVDEIPLTPSGKRRVTVSHLQ